MSHTSSVGDENLEVVVVTPLHDILWVLLTRVLKGDCGPGASQLSMHWKVGGLIPASSLRPLGRNILGHNTRRYCLLSALSCVED